MRSLLCKTTAVVLLAWTILTVNAQTNWIIQWNPNVLPGKYEIDQGLKKITILEGDTGIF